MNKVKYLSECLKSFTFEDMYLLAEMPKEELQNALQELIKENTLKKTAQGYIYSEFTQIQPPIKFVIKNENAKFVEDEDCIKLQEVLFPEAKNLTTQDLKQIPEFNRKKYDKYVRLLKATKGLYGKALMSFISEYNRLNPNDKTSYPTLIRKRKLCATIGTSGLITKYGHPGKVYYPDMEKYYPIFKSLYLSPLKLSIETAREYTAMRLNLPLENFPSGMAFRRRLYKELPKEVIKSIRRQRCF